MTKAVKQWNISTRVVPASGVTVLWRLQWRHCGSRAETIGCRAPASGAKDWTQVGIRWDEIEAQLLNSWNHSAFKNSWRLRWFDKRDEFWWNEVALKNRCNPIIRSRIFSSIPCAGHRHQIRVHLASCGHPILGDDAYHGQPWGIRGTCHRTLGRWNGEGFSDLCNLVVGRWRSCWIEVIILE